MARAQSIYNWVHKEKMRLTEKRRSKNMPKNKQATPADHRPTGAACLKLRCRRFE